MILSFPLAQGLIKSCGVSVENVTAWLQTLKTSLSCVLPASRPRLLPWNGGSRSLRGPGLKVKSSGKLTPLRPSGHLLADAEWPLVALPCPDDVSQCAPLPSCKATGGLLGLHLGENSQSPILETPVNLFSHYL